MKPPFQIPKGWSKGEPLTFHKKSESCFDVYRSGSYMDTPGFPFNSEVNSIQFDSRVAMNEFLEWWAAPPPEQRAIELTRHEYLEYVEEMLSFAPRRFSGVLESVVPRAAAMGDKGSLDAGLCYRGGTEAEVDALRKAHSAYVAKVRNILGVRSSDD
jgi:hypothetical protein